MRALLAAQLPPNARVRIFDNPDNAWSQETFILRDLEFNFRAFMWGLAPKSSRGAEPTPILSPLEKLNEEKKYEQIHKKLEAAKSVLGSGIGRG